MLVDENDNEITDHRGGSVRNVSEADIQQMLDFLFGAVRAMCKDGKGAFFAARDFLGGANYFWQGTPMYRLFEKYHDDEGYTSDEAVEAAGKTAGHLLKRVLIRDSVRVYRLEDAGMANGYRWIEDVEERNARRAKELES